VTSAAREGVSHLYRITRDVTVPAGAYGRIKGRYRAGDLVRLEPHGALMMAIGPGGVQWVPEPATAHQHTGVSN